MNNLNTIKFLLKGLDCPNCAMKIESKVNNLNTVESAVLNFSTSMLTLNIKSNTQKDEVKNKITTIVKTLEPDVDVIEQSTKIISHTNYNFLLEGLDCPNCAMKIESKVNSLEGVNSATLNFSTSLLTIDLNNKVQADNIKNKIVAIVKTLEPDVNIIEQKNNLKTTTKMTILFEGLHCANCAAKIEKKVKNLNMLTDSQLNFSSSTLNIEFYKTHSKNSIFNAIKEIVDSTEPGIKIKLKSPIKEIENSKNESLFNLINKKSIIRLGIGVIVFLFALLFKSNFYTNLTLFIISYLIIGKNVLLKALTNLRHGEVFDENFLMVIATLGAFSIGEFPEAIAVMLFYEVGETFQNIAVNRSRKSIADLMDVRPDKANLKIGENIEEVAPEDVSIGDIIVIKPFEKVPLDGIVIEGTSSIDTSALTGESLPKQVDNGDKILSGCINQNGILTIKVTKDFSESTVSKILELVENAGSKKAKTEQFITKFAKIYTPAVVISAIALAFIPPMFIKDSNLMDWIRRSLIFLVVSCPCALVISIPLGFFGGIGAASKVGVLIKGSNFLEGLNYLDTVVFDKTGTLTKGIFEVTKLYNEPNVSKEDLLKYAALCEAYSSHPIGKSILKAYKQKIHKHNLKNYEEISGHGIKTEYEGKTLLAGNSKLMDKFNIKYNPISDSDTIVYVAVDNKFYGSISISDAIKEDSKQAIDLLKNYGVNNLIMLTGDNKKTAQAIAKELGINEVHYELLPEDKVKVFEKILNRKNSNSKVAFVGDGINDAPVLARADIGFAMGGLGSDAAIEAADIVIMNDNLSKICNALKISKYTKKIVTENIIFSLTVKLGVLILGALGLATMWAAVFADVGVALIAVINSMRVLKVK